MQIRCSYSRIVKIRDLKLNANNRNIHPPDQIQRLAEVLKYQGWRYCVKVSNLSGIVTSGHGRVEAALLNGWDEVPVDDQDYDTAAQEFADTVADNSLAAWAELNLSGINQDLTLHGPELNIDMLGLRDFAIEPMDRIEPDIDRSNGDGESHEKDDEIPEVIEPHTGDGDSFRVGPHRLMNGDCLKRLKELQSDSVDSLCTDPPAGIGFMGKAWDDDKGGGKQWTAWLKEVMSEALRVLRPGAHALVWAIPRTSHWTATALEDAGFEIRDIITHLFGSGFPKSLNISKAIDKMNGDEDKRPVIGEKRSGLSGGSGNTVGRFTDNRNKNGNVDITSAASAASAAWEGWGTSLKPASEHWVLCRKPLAEDTVAANVLEYGTGGLNIDASRIGTETRTYSVNGNIKGGNFGNKANQPANERAHVTAQGRFPANLVLSHNPDCESHTEQVINPDYEEDEGLTKFITKEINDCTPGCAVALLDGQSGQFAGLVGGKQTGSFEFHAGVGGRSGKGIEGGVKDFGGASRFFYCAKASKSERNAGCDGLTDKSVHRLGEGNHPEAPVVEKNSHPTVKPTALMSYLITLITPPDGVVLDCFGGSGTTLVACHRKGFRALLIEQSREYCDIILARAEHVTGKHLERVNG